MLSFRCLVSTSRHHSANIRKCARAAWCSQISHNTACRCCSRWSTLIRRWDTLTDRGLAIANELVNARLSRRYATPSALGSLALFADATVSLEAHNFNTTRLLYPQLVQVCADLKTALDQMVAVNASLQGLADGPELIVCLGVSVTRFGEQLPATHGSVHVDHKLLNIVNHVNASHAYTSLCSFFMAYFCAYACHPSLNLKNLFVYSPAHAPCGLATASETLAGLYAQEFAVREAICADVLSPGHDRRTHLLALTAWMTEPYVDNQSHIKRLVQEVAAAGAANGP